MPYEVFNLFSRCAETHGAHSTLEDAYACFNQLTERYGGDIPVHPISQRHVFWIVAVDRKGNQRNFSAQERQRAETLRLDPRSVEADIPSITTFSHAARMYCEASRLMPVTGINLKGLFDHRSRDRHFWITDAGKGQALAYAQQAVFTLELSLKAYLEVLGKLASSNARDIRKWQTHDLIDLFNLLDEEEKKQLESWWNQSDAKRIHFEGSFREFLSGSNKLYKKWRYITDLTSTDLCIDMPRLLSVSEFLLSASDQVFRDKSPIKINVTTTTHPSAEDDEGKPMSQPVPTLVEGRVRAVRIPDGFDPHGVVEVVVDSDQHQGEVVAQFYRRNVKDYYGLDGKWVSLIGGVRADEPHLLLRPSHRDEPTREPAYTSEYRTLRGVIYDIKIVHPAYGQSEKVHLALWDETFFTQVECFFTTEEERDQLKVVNLGERATISGHVTLLNGKPMLLVAPTRIEKLIEDPDR